MTAVWVVLVWEDDNVFDIVGVFGAEDTAKGVADRSVHRTVQRYELDRVEDWGR